MRVTRRHLAITGLQPLCATEVVSYSLACIFIAKTGFSYRDKISELLEAFRGAESRLLRDALSTVAGPAGTYALVAQLREYFGESAVRPLPAGLGPAEVIDSTMRIVDDLVQSLVAARSSWLSSSGPLSAEVLEVFGQARAPAASSSALRPATAVRRPRSAPVPEAAAARPKRRSCAGARPVVAKAAAADAPLRTPVKLTSTSASTSASASASALFADLFAPPAPRAPRRRSASVGQPRQLPSSSPGRSVAERSSPLPATAATRAAAPSLDVLPRVKRKASAAPVSASALAPSGSAALSVPPASPQTEEASSSKAATEVPEEGLELLSQKASPSPSPLSPFEPLGGQVEGRGGRSSGGVASSPSQTMVAPLGSGWGVAPVRLFPHAVGPTVAAAGLPVRSALSCLGPLGPTETPHWVSQALAAEAASNEEIHNSGGFAPLRAAAFGRAFALTGAIGDGAEGAICEVCTRVVDDCTMQELEHPDLGTQSVLVCDTCLAMQSWPDFMMVSRCISAFFVRKDRQGRADAETPS